MRTPRSAGSSWPRPRSRPQRDRSSAYPHVNALSHPREPGAPDADQLTGTGTLTAVLPSLRSVRPRLRLPFSVFTYARTPSAACRQQSRSTSRSRARAPHVKDWAAVRSDPARQPWISELVAAPRCGDRAGASRPSCSRGRLRRSRVCSHSVVSRSRVCSWVRRTVYGVGLFMATGSRRRPAPAVRLPVDHAGADPPVAATTSDPSSEPARQVTSRAVPRGGSHGDLREYARASRRRRLNLHPDCAAIVKAARMAGATGRMFHDTDFARVRSTATIDGR